MSLTSFLIISYESIHPAGWLHGFSLRALGRLEARHATPFSGSDLTEAFSRFRKWSRQQDAQELCAEKDIAQMAKLRTLKKPKASQSCALDTMVEAYAFLGSLITLVQSHFTTPDRLAPREINSCIYHLFYWPKREHCCPWHWESRNFASMTLHMTTWSSWGAFTCLTGIDGLWARC